MTVSSQVFSFWFLPLVLLVYSTSLPVGVRHVGLTLFQAQVRYMRHTFQHALLLLMVCLGGWSQAEEIHVLSSPDPRIQVSFHMPVAGSIDGPRWSATFRGEPILTGCGLGLRTADSGELLAGARVLRGSSRSVDERVAVLFGKADHANDRFNEIRYTVHLALDGGFVARLTPIEQ